LKRVTNPVPRKKGSFMRERKKRQFKGLPGALNWTGKGDGHEKGLKKRKRPTRPFRKKKD